jgi:hypothetical protein
VGEQYSDDAVLFLSNFAAAKKQHKALGTSRLHQERNSKAAHGRDKPSVMNFVKAPCRHPQLKDVDYVGVERDNIRSGHQG